MVVGLDLGCMRVRAQGDSADAPVSRWDIVHGLDGFGKMWPKVPAWVTPIGVDTLCLLGGIWKALLSLVHNGKLLVETGHTCELMLLNAGKENDEPGGAAVEDGGSSWSFESLFKGATATEG